MFCLPIVRKWRETSQSERFHLKSTMWNLCNVRDEECELIILTNIIVAGFCNPKICSTAHYLAQFALKGLILSKYAGKQVSHEDVSGGLTRGSMGGEIPRDPSNYGGAKSQCEAPNGCGGAGNSQ